MAAGEFEAAYAGHEAGLLPSCGKAKDGPRFDEGRPSIVPRKVQLRISLYVLLLVCDCAAVLLGMMVGNLIRFHNAFAQGGINLLAVLLPTFVIFAFRNEAYTLRTLGSLQLGCKRAITALAVAAVMIIFVIFFMKTSSAFSRLVLVFGISAGALFIMLFRITACSLGRQWLGGSPLSEVMILDEVSCTAPPGWTLFDAANAHLTPDIGDPKMLDRLGRLLKHADRVVVACRPERRRAWAMVLKGANVRGELIEPTADEMGVLAIGRHQQLSTLVVSSGVLGAHDRAIKRIFDLTLASMTLVVLAPLLLMVAAAVALEDGGPILFRQERLGLGNRLFHVLKFRSMRVASCDQVGAVSTVRGDARITRVGHLIRATSIDELPQLINILRGEMSFVGPRPHALGSLAGEKLFWEIDSKYWHRHAAKPGLTGLAQVRGFRGATASQSDLLNRLQSDLEYLQNWSIWRDMRIIAATILVLVHPNAY